MSKFDRADPGLDPDYCDGLAEPFDSDRAEVYVSHEHVADSPEVFGFPSPPSSEDHFDIESYGLALLRYILSADVEVYGLISTVGLQAAEYSARLAVGHSDVEPIAVDRISAVRMRIAAVLATRIVAESTVNTIAPPIVSPVQDGGQTSRTVDRPIVPVSPAGIVDIRF